MAKSKSDPSEDAVRLRSYYIWEAEGRPVGRALSHWLRAKAELAAKAGAGPDPTAPVPSRVPISRRPDRIRADKVKLG